MHPLTPFTSANVAVLFHKVPSRDWFARTCRTIGRFHRFAGLTELESVVRGGERLRGRCLICFDDADRSVYEHAFPVLVEEGIPAALFVSPKIVEPGFRYWFDELEILRETAGEDPLRRSLATVLGCEPGAIRGFRLSAIFKCLRLRDIRRVLDHVRRERGIEGPAGTSATPEQFLEMARSPLVTTGAHTLDHPVLANEDDETAEEEILGSVRGLATMLGHEVGTFAYPNGKRGLDFGEREERLLEKAGIRIAFTTQRAFIDGKTEPLAVPRAGFSGSESETAGFVAATLMLVPIWERLRDRLAPGNECRQRREILRRGILPRMR